MLSGDISTALRGRSIEIKVYPLSFSEYYAHVKGDKRVQWNNYLKYGGFPFIAKESDEQAKIEMQKGNMTVKNKRNLKC